MTGSAHSQGISVQASVASQPGIEADEPIRLTLGRAPGRDERIAVLIGNTDLSELFQPDSAGTLLTYQADLMPLPVGESELVVYLVDAENHWREASRFPVKIRAAGAFETAKIVPTLDVNVKTQHFDNRYPDPAATPARRVRYTDVDGRFHLATEHSKPRYALDTEWDVQGFSYRNDALNYALKGDAAPKIDLANYRIHLRFHKNELTLGGVSFGANRLLLDNFGSRGAVARIPLWDDRVDIGLADLNGQSIVGADNFTGLNRTDNQVRAASAGWNVVRSEKAALRVEFTAMQASLLPLPLLNQAALTDAEKSRGWGVKMTGRDPWRRLDFDVGLARSRFDNPPDPLLAQDQTLVALQAAEKQAVYANAQLKLIQALGLTYNFQRADPEYRSIGAFVRSNFEEHQYGAAGGAGGVSYQLSLSRSQDNLDDIRSMITTQTRRWGARGEVRTADLFGAQTAVSWYPSVNCSYELTHQLGLFDPVNASGIAPGALPNQIARNESGGVDWRFGRWGLGTVLSYTSVDNQQITRGDADFQTVVKTLRLNANPRDNLSLSLDLNFSRTFSVAQNAVSRTTGWAVNGDYKPFSKTTLNFSYSTTHDVAALSSESLEGTASVRVAQQFLSAKRAGGQVFLAYNQSLLRSVDSISSATTLKNRWALNSGVSLNFF